MGDLVHIVDLFEPAVKGLHILLNRAPHKGEHNKAEGNGDHDQDTIAALPCCENTVNIC